MHHFIIALIQLTAPIAANISLGKIFDKKIYLQTDNIVLDTLDWKNIDKRHGLVTNASNPVAACSTYNANGMCIFKVSQATGMTLAILKDLGYEIIVLSQWNMLPNDMIKINMPSTDSEYGRRRFMSDFLWETVKKIDIKGPTKLVEDYTLSISFEDAGYCSYMGKEEILNAFPQMLSSEQTIRIYFDNGMVEELLVKRKMYKAYLLTDKNKKASDIIGEIEAGMDKMKLDMSYTVPKITAVEFKKK
jgi:hypothetical protein